MMKHTEKRTVMNLSSSKLITENARVARSIWPEICKSELLVLKKLTTSLELDLRSGDLIRLNNLWYVTHSGLLRLATRRRCSGIHTQPILKSSDPAGSRWVFKATVFKSPKCKGLLVTAMPTRQTSLRLCMAPRCASRRREQSTVHFERHMVSASVRLRKSGLSLVLC